MCELQVNTSSKTEAPAPHPLTTICTAVGTIKPDATTRGTKKLIDASSHTHRLDLDRVDTAEEKAGLQNNALTDARHVDRPERAAKEVHRARAACPCTSIASTVPRRHSLPPSTYREKPAAAAADEPNWRARAVTEATRR